MIKFRATDQQVAEILALAVNASHPGGPQSLGWLHYRPEKIFTADELLPYIDKGTDYVQGRMVKCRPERLHGDLWQLHDPPDVEYQSWVETYPTSQALVEAAGVKIL